MLITVAPGTTLALRRTRGLEVIAATGEIPQEGAANGAPLFGALFFCHFFSGVRKEMARTPQRRAGVVAPYDPRQA